MFLVSRFIRGLAASAISAIAAAGAAFAEPGLWVVKDKDSTIYLFGTVHMLKPDTVWHSPKIDKALGSAKELWLELPTTDPAAMAGADAGGVQNPNRSRRPRRPARKQPRPLPSLVRRCRHFRRRVSGLRL